MQPGKKEMSTHIWLSCCCSMLMLLGVRHLSCCSSGFCLSFPKMRADPGPAFYTCPVLGPLLPSYTPLKEVAMLGGWEKECMAQGYIGDILAQKPVNHTCSDSAPPTQTLVGPTLLPTGPGGGMVSPWMASQTATALDCDFNDINLCSSLGQTSPLCALLLSLSFPRQ